MDRKAQKAETRNRLVALAAKAIREEGPHRISVDGLMARLGLTHGGFYAHFPSKEALVLEAIDAMFDQSEAMMRRAMGDGTPADALRRYVESYLTPAHVENPGSGCALPSVGADTFRLGEAARNRYWKGVERLVGIVARQFAALGLDADTAEAKATVLLGNLAGTLMLARAAPSHARRSLLARAQSEYTDRWRPARDA